MVTQSENKTAKSTWILSQIEFNNIFYFVLTQFHFISHKPNVNINLKLLLNLDSWGDLKFAEQTRDLSKENWGKDWTQLTLMITLSFQSLA